MSRFLIINTDKNFCSQVARIYGGPGHEVKNAVDTQNAVDLLKKWIFDVVIFDTSTPGLKAPFFVDQVKKINSNTIVIITSKKEEDSDAIEAINDGAYDFLQRPCNFSELQVKINKAINLRRLKHEATSLRGERNIIYRTENFIGESPGIKKIFEIVGKVAYSNSTILLTGETGTGKELVAGALHYNSQRSGNGFVKVNCAALPEQLLQSELFGHEKGAYTGADKQRIGRFEQADGGSIFLDEIGDMTLHTQAKVLRVLQEREFERLGGSKTIKVDVRIITATNKNLQEEIKEGRFREDLFYRLNVVTIKMPPLRERKGDIILLTYFFLKKFSVDMKKKIKEIHPLAIKTLTEYSWPGNIRELQNTIERAVLMADHIVIKLDDLQLPVKTGPLKWDHTVIQIPPGGIHLEEVEKGLVLQALNMCNWIQKDAAGLLGISSRVLNYKIQRHGITHQNWKRYK